MKEESIRIEVPIGVRQFSKQLGLELSGTLQALLAVGHLTTPNAMVDYKVAHRTIVYLGMQDKVELIQGAEGFA